MAGRWTVVVLAACGLLLASPGCGDSTAKPSGTKKKTSSAKGAGETEPPAKAVKKAPEKAKEQVPEEAPASEDDMPDGEEDDG